MITLLVIMIVVALLLPVGVFVPTAGRFGAEDRDRRLAALRLVGADTLGTTRVAAAETLVGALGGVVVGALLLGACAARPAPRHRGGERLRVDVRPTPALAALVAVLVPLGAVAATLLGIRRVAIEPLGVSRQRRPAAAAGLAAPRARARLPAARADDRLRRSSGSTGGQIQATAGVVLVLVGITALLPWLVELDRPRDAPDGPLPWLLAIRRLRTDEGTTGRVVGAIGLAVAGAIALQLLFSGAEIRAARPQACLGVLSTINGMIAPGHDSLATVTTPAADSSGSAQSARVGSRAAGACRSRSPRAQPSPSCCRSRRAAHGSSYLRNEPGSSSQHPGQLIRMPGRSLRTPCNARTVSLRPEFSAGVDYLDLASLILTQGAAARAGLAVGDALGKARGSIRTIPRRWTI